MEIKNNGKIAIVGDKDSVTAFKALGVKVVPETNPFAVREALKRLAREHYAVILITERAASGEGVPEAIEKYKTEAYPIIIPIPDSAGTTGFGIQGLKRDVEKAIGADIVFNK